MIKLSAATGAILAVLPAIVGESGGIWAAMHVGGGALALSALVAAALRRPARQRWAAALGLAISIVLVSVNLSGGSVGDVVQTVGLLVLATVFGWTVFSPESPSEITADR
ncbi:MAG: hypothetical protein HZB14_00235 [Actinobacteria bacterium]|nr:hypothetical protein [Actinomycetota bacterium]